MPTKSMEEFESSVSKGEKVKGPIKSITDFGVFIGLPGNIDGLVHLSDLSWSEVGEEAVKRFKKGEELEAVVMAVDVERERISLSVKQLDSEARELAVKLEKGQLVTGEVKSVDQKAAIVEIDNGQECILRAQDVAREKVDDIRTVLSEGDKIEALVVNHNKKSGELMISMKAKELADTAEVMEKMAADSGNQSGKTNLGALLKAN